MYYEHRNGVVEQVRFYRQQPESMKHAPFDFELDAEHKHKAALDFAVGITCVLCFIGLYLWVYVK